MTLETIAMSSDDATVSLPAMADSVWVLKRDIWPDRAAPCPPDQNGWHERMHRTLGEDVAGPAAASLAEQRAAFDVRHKDYNTLRPHEALGQRSG
jgi:transposase InsO family protein